MRDRLTLLLQIHALVGFREQLFGIQPVLGIHGLADAQRQNVLVADFLSGLLRQFPHLFRFARGSFRRKARER